jgi:hypothetical protein
MKSCPVCNESFGDDLNFCDLDGTRLNNAGTDSQGRRSDRLWSLLGLGLLVGAICLSAASILFFPKAQVSPAPLRPQTSPLQTDNASSGNSGQNSVEPSAQQPEPQTDRLLSEAAARVAITSEKTAQPKAPLEAQTTDGAADGERPSLKAMAQEGGEKKPEDKREREKVQPAVESPEKSASTSEVTKEPKATRETKERTPSKDSNSNRKTEKEKKGGFLKVFKKIFGKN